MLALALASYFSLYPGLLLPPLLLLSYDRVHRDEKATRTVLAFIATNAGSFFAGVGLLLYMSYLITGSSWEFLPSTYGVQLLLPDLTPNVGLWWYFFIEMFDSFREFFLGVFWLHLGSYVGGLSIRVRRQPLFVITSMLGIFAIFKPYPSISDTSLYFALLPLYAHIFPRKSGPFPINQLANSPSSAAYLSRIFDLVVYYLSRSCLLLPLDLRRIRKCQLLLRHYTCVEYCTVPHGRGLYLCSPS